MEKWKSVSYELHIFSFKQRLLWAYNTRHWAKPCEVYEHCSDTELSLKELRIQWKGGQLYINAYNQDRKRWVS